MSPFFPGLRWNGFVCARTGPTWTVLRGSVDIPN